MSRFSLKEKVNFLFSSLLVLLLVYSVAGQSIFNIAGKPFKKSFQQTREPKIVVDTVSLSSGYGYIELNKQFTRGQHSVTATSGDYMFAVACAMGDDTSVAVYSYACIPSSQGDSLTIKSSDSGDTNNVVVMIIMR